MNKMGRVRQCENADLFRAIQVASQGFGILRAAPKVIFRTNDQHTGQNRGAVVQLPADRLIKAIFQCAVGSAQTRRMAGSGSGVAGQCRLLISLSNCGISPQ